MAESATTQKRNAGNTEHDITLVSRKQRYLKNQKINRNIMMKKVKRKSRE